jgi:hypothetical protein
MDKVLQVHQWSDDDGDYYNVWALPLNLVSFSAVSEFSSRGINKDYYLGQFRDGEEFIELARHNGCTSITITLESE